MKYLHNLRSDLAHEFTGPIWAWQPTTPIPPRAATDKRFRDGWITNPDLRHCVYALCEGINPNCRIKARGADDEGNDVAVVHGFAADIDAPHSDAALTEFVSRLPFKPAAIEKTLSGNSRFIFFFEKPTKVFGSEGYKALAKIVLEKLQLKTLGGLDEGAWTNPTRYFTNSGVWCVLDAAARIPDSQVRGWVFESSRELGNEFAKEGTAIPFEALQDALKGRYPRFADWPGDFVDGAQGPTFWVEGSASPMSARVHVTGIYTFSAHAHKPFFTWTDLLGREFVQQYEADRRGKLAEGVFYNGVEYLYQDPSGAWFTHNKDETLLFLRVERGASPRKDRDTQLSELNCVLHFINSQQRIQASGPCQGWPAGRILIGGEAVLNTRNNRVPPPHSAPTTFGPEGEFPFISGLLAHMMEPEQLEIFMSWAAYGYRNALRSLGLPGQALVLAGPANSGKTLLSSSVLPQVFGGGVEANDYFTASRFNQRVFSQYFWSVDDNTLVTDTKTKNLYSAQLKALVANSRHTVEEKFQKSGTVYWAGRVMITMNEDFESLRQLPAMDMSNKDKTVLLRARGGFPFPDRTLTDATVAKEAPFFAAYLRDFEIPKHLQTDTRYGMATYHDDTLLTHARQASDTHAFLEILDGFMSDWLANNKGKQWVGTSATLRQQMECAGHTAVKSYSVVRCGQLLSQLREQRTTRFAIECRTVSGNLRQWTIADGGDTKESHVIP